MSKESLARELDVIFDAPPLLAVTDAQILSTLVDGVLFVVNYGTDRNAVSRGADHLRQVNVNVLGFVINRMTSTDGGEYYYYNYYYYDEESTSDQTQEFPDYVNGNGVYDVLNQHTSSIKPDSTVRPQK